MPATKNATGIARFQPYRRVRSSKRNGRHASGYVAQQQPGRVPARTLATVNPADGQATEGTTVVGMFRTYRESVNALIELRERFDAADIAVIVRYRGKPVPVGRDITAITREAEYVEREFWGSPTTVFVRANGSAQQVRTYFNFCGAYVSKRAIQRPGPRLCKVTHCFIVDSRDRCMR